MGQETKKIHRIKKYVNRKLYDTTDKRYLTLEQVAELIKTGDEVLIEDNKTGEDITSSVVSQILAKEKAGKEDEVTAGILISLLRKGQGTFSGYARRYLGMWQSAVTMAEDEIDKLVKLLVKDKELSESEGSRLKKEMLTYAEQFKSWIMARIDQRINEVLGMMNLATREQVVNLTERIETLTRVVEKLEKAQQAVDAQPAIDPDQTDESNETAEPETESASQTPASQTIA